MKPEQSYTTDKCSHSLQTELYDIYFYASAEALCSWVVHVSVTELVNMLFWKRMNQFWRKSAQVVHGTRASNNPLLGQLVKVTPGQNRSQKSISARFSKNYPMNFHQIWHAHITVNARCVTMTQIQKARSMPYEAEDKLGGVVEASFSTPHPPPESSSFSSSIL